MMRQRDRGTAGVDTAIAVTAMLMATMFIVGALRIAGTNGDVSTAARAGARAAAAARSSGGASAAASNVATEVLTNRGVACAGGPAVGVSGGGAPGSAVTVTVRCTVSLSDAVIAGFPGSREVSVSATEYVDAVRGNG